jgi:hypothetical protein
MPGRACPLGRVEAKADQASDQASLTVAAPGQRHELTRLGVAGDEQKIQDPERTAAEGPFEHAQQPPLERGLGWEAVREQPARLHARSSIRRDRRLHVIRMG